MDGTTVPIDMSALVEYNTFGDTTTISIQEDANHNVKANINDNSVSMIKLASDVHGKFGTINNKIEKIEEQIQFNIAIDGSTVAGTTLIAGKNCRFDEQSGTLIAEGNYMVVDDILVIK